MVLSFSETAATRIPCDVGVFFENALSGRCLTRFMGCFPTDLCIWQSKTFTQTCRIGCGSCSTYLGFRALVQNPKVVLLEVIVASVSKLVYKQTYLGDVFTTYIYRG